MATTDESSLEPLPQVLAGPEYDETGDPQWIESPIHEGGAHPGDRFVTLGRWRERIYPTGIHPADENQHTLCRAGLRQAVRRLFDVLNPTDAKPAQAGETVNDDATVKAILATYEALEWVHSFWEYMRDEEKLFAAATDIDPLYGPYVEGAVGARNASHHGVRRVVGIVPVEHPIYLLTGRRWIHARQMTSETYLQVRWVESLPGEPIRSANQNAAFIEHLAGREVRNTFNAISAFFFYSVRGEAAPYDMLFTPARNPPNTDPDWERLVEVARKYGKLP